MIDSTDHDRCHEGGPRYAVVVLDSAGSLRVAPFRRAGRDRGGAILAVVASRVVRVTGGES
jgi:hypothetical protein